MDSVTSESLNKLALLIFEKTGLSRCVPSIQDEVEEQIEGSYTRINEDEEDSSSTPYYGGVVYHRFKAVEDGKFCYQLDSELSNSEKKLFERLIQDNSLDISVERTDFSGQKWSFNLLIPFVLNKHESDSFELSFRIKVTGFRTRYEIESHTWSEVTEDEISKTLTMYSLQI
jgi:hypothetical protein